VCLSISFTVANIDMSSIRLKLWSYKDRTLLSTLCHFDQQQVIAIEISRITDSSQLCDLSKISA